MKRREKGTVTLVPDIGKSQKIFFDLIHTEGKRAPKPRVLTMIETRVHMLVSTLPSLGYICEGAFENSKNVLSTTSQAISRELGLTVMDTRKVAVR